MSEKSVKVKPRKVGNTFFKWSMIVVIVLLLEIGTIFAAVMIIENRGKSDTIKIQNTLAQISEQDVRLSALEKLPSAISTNTEQLVATTRAVNLLSDNFNRLKAEVGDNKVLQLKTQLDALNHQVESLEELKNQESLILSLALMIKENALYHRKFSREADILTQLGQNNDLIKADIEVINQYKEDFIADNNELSKQYQQMIENLSFSNKEEEPKPEGKNTAVSKGVKMIKDTISGIHFDRVVVLKKEKRTEQQKNLLEQLTKLVNSYNYAKALNYINSNEELKNINNQDFKVWQEAVQKKEAFDNAVSHIIAAQLSALRQDIKDGVISSQPPLNEENTSVVTEEKVND